MLNTVWVAKTGYQKGARVEKHIYSDGSEHYSFIDRFGRPHNATQKDAEKIIKTEHMEEVTTK